MFNYFMDLPKNQKIGFICFVFVALACSIAFILSLFDNNEEVPTPTPSSTISSPADNNDPEPSASATATAEPEATASAPAPSPSATVQATSSASEMPEITYGESKIPVEEIRALQGVADEGIVQFLTWNAGEKVTDRSARISKYFVKGSPLITLAPDLEEMSSYDNPNGVPAMVSLGSIDYINAVGGDTSTYRLTIGTLLRAQYNYNESATEKSSVIQTNSTIAVDMTKEDGVWKIKTISEE